MRIAPLFARPVSLVAASYIARHRRKFLPAGKPLSNSQLSNLAPFFPLNSLKSAKIVAAGVPVPPLYSLLRKFGPSTLPEVRLMAGITFVDVILYSDKLTQALLFHELVHVVQYEVLGLKLFAERYVRGFLKFGSYDGIPLEKQAYTLGARFERRPEKVFSVLDQVLEWQEGNRF